MKHALSTNPTALRRVVATAALGVALVLPASAYAAPVRVMIDPGHGGKDPGAMSGGVVEKKTNMQISRLIAKEASRQGWDVAMTRTTDRFIPLARRPKRASQYRADVFISVHSNSMGKAPKGNMTIYRSKQGQRLGKAIMSEMAPLTPYKDIGNRRDSRGLAVLRGANKPAVIIEILSVSAPSERKQLKDPKVQQLYAEAVVRGIAKYKQVDYKPTAQPEAVAKPTPTPVTELTSSTPSTMVPITQPATSPPADADVTQTPRSETPSDSADDRSGLLRRIIGILNR